MPAIAAYESIKGFSVFDECADDSWADTESYCCEVAESRRAYYPLPPRVLRTRIVDTSGVVLLQRQKSSERYSLEQEFKGLVKEWKQATAHFSSERQQTAHLSFLRIIVLGEKAIPLILEEFRREPIPGWLPALEAFAGKDVASNAKTYQEAIDCWINWGKDKQYLKS